MISSTIRTVGLCLGLFLPCACSPSPQAAAPAPVAAAAPTPPPPPAKKATMICRNSQDGRPVECGTPNAVMVGIKTE
jgi:hypothetical protein